MQISCTEILADLGQVSAFKATWIIPENCAGGHFFIQALFVFNFEDGVGKGLFDNAHTCVCARARVCAWMHARVRAEDTAAMNQDLNALSTSSAPVLLPGVGETDRALW